MVTLDNLGLRVQVVVNGSPAEEFLQPGQLAPNARDGGVGSQPFIYHRYIESVVNAKFSIFFEALDSGGLLKDWVDADAKNFVRLAILIDGQSVGATRVSCKKRTATFRGVKNYANNTMQDFQFAAVSPIEDATKELEAEHIEQSKELGTIQVRFYRVVEHQRLEVGNLGSQRNGSKQSSSKQHQSERNQNQRDLSSNGTSGLGQGDEIALAEKALKGRALLHGASLAPTTSLNFAKSLGSANSPAASSRPSTSSRSRPADGLEPIPTRIGPTILVRWEWVDAKKTPFAIATFMYRSKDALKQELVIPRTPSPEPSPSPEPRTVDDFSQEGIRRLAQERLSDLETRKRAARPKKEDGEAAWLPRPLKYVRLSGGSEAIDLTDDD